MSVPTAEKIEDKFGLDRIVFFSDAVIAIAITLLVIEIGVPKIEAAFVDIRLAHHVLEMWPEYLGYAVSFWVIANYWVAHHTAFRLIIDYDRRLIYINILFLMFIAFMPHTTALLFKYPGQPVSVIMYAGLIAAIGLTMLWMWSYATRNHRLVDKTVAQSTINSLAKSLLITPAVFLISIVIALFNPHLAMYSWIILLPLYFWYSRKQKGLHS